MSLKKRIFCLTFPQPWYRVTVTHLGDCFALTITVANQSWGDFPFNGVIDL